MRLLDLTEEAPKKISFEIRGREVYILVDGHALNMPWSLERVSPENAMALDFESELAESMRFLLTKYVKCDSAEAERATQEFKALIPQLMH